MLYAYCLSDELKADEVTGVAGVEGTVVRVVEIGKIKAVVSDLDRKRAELTRENIAAHEAVIRQALAGVTPLPFRFGCVVSEEELEKYLMSKSQSLLGRLENVRGAIEMSVKVLWDAEAIGRMVDETDGVAGAAAREGHQTGPGAAFLASKRREMRRAEQVKERAEEIAGWLAGEVGEAVRESNVQILSTPAMAVRAAHLVARDRLKDYRARVDEARGRRPGLRFLTSGPWPPYSFCELGP